MTEKRFTYWEEDIGQMLIPQCRDNGNTVARSVYECVDLLNELATKCSQLKKENEQLKKDCTTLIYNNQEYRKENEQLKEENKNLKAQLYSDDEEGICNQCKYHYLVKNEDSEFGYYNSRCRKGHTECARMSLRYCNDFDINIKKSD